MSCCCNRSFRLPTFNLTINVWHANDPYTTAKDFSCLGQLLPGQFVYNNGPAAGNTLGSFSGMILLVPKNTDLRDYSDAGALIDYVEVPAGSGRFYQVTYVDDVSKGFATEHRFAVIHKYTTMTGVWATPIP